MKTLVEFLALLLGAILGTVLWVAHDEAPAPRVIAPATYAYPVTGYEGGDCIVSAPTWCVVPR